MIKKLNKIFLIFLFCLQTNLLSSMTFDPTQRPILQAEYKRWLGAGNKGSMSEFIYERVAGYSEANERVKKLEDKVEEQASRLAILGEGTQKDVVEKIVKAEQSKFEKEIEKYKQELQHTKAELEKTQKTLESAKAVLAQQETTFATKSGDLEKKYADLEKQAKKLDVELKVQQSALTEARAVKSQLQSELEQARDLNKGQQESIEQQKSELESKIKSLETKLPKLEAGLAKAEQEKNNLEKEKTALEQKIATKDVDIAFVKQSVEKVQKDLGSAKVLLSQQKEEVDALQKEKQQMSKELAKFRFERQKIEKAEAEKQKDLAQKKLKQAAFWGELNDLLKTPIGDNIDSFRKLYIPGENFIDLIGKQDAYKQNIFHYLAKFGAQKILYYLIRQALWENISLEKYLNSQDSEGNTPLHYVLFNLKDADRQKIDKQLEMAKILLRMGARDDISNKNNNTSYIIAEQFGLRDKYTKLRVRAVGEKGIFMPYYFKD